MGIGIYTSAAIESKENLGAVIGTVSENAARLGVIQGSQILSINGIDVSTKTFEEMRPLLDRAKWPLKMVLRIPSKDLNWHEAKDSLRGTSTYNEAYCNDDLEDVVLGPHSFSCAFNFSDVKEYLFSTGDGERWAILSKDDFETFRKNVQSIRMTQHGPRTSELRVTMSHLRSIKYRSQVEVTSETRGPMIFLDETADPQDDEPGKEWLYAEQARPARGRVRAYLISHRGVNVWVR